MHLFRHATVYQCLAMTPDTSGVEGKEEEGGGRVMEGPPDTSRLRPVVTAPNLGDEGTPFTPSENRGCEAFFALPRSLYNILLAFVEAFVARKTR